MASDKPFSKLKHLARQSLNIFEGIERIGMIVNQTTHISGFINEASFTGEGYGTIDTSTNTSTTHVEFSGFPSTFTPVLCRSWKCKAHPPAVDPIDARANFIKALGANYDMDEIVRYIGGASGEVHTTGQTRRTSATHGMSRNAVTTGPSPTPYDSEIVGTFIGTYDGPVDAASVPVHWEQFTPTATRGVLSTYGYREVLMASGATVATEWSGTLTMILQESDIWDPFEFRQDYSWQSFEWNYGSPTSILNKQFILSVSVP